MIAWITVTLQFIPPAIDQRGPGKIQLPGDWRVQRHEFLKLSFEEWVA
jgi:hypothetical protein